jgi:hypothetical protein
MARKEPKPIRKPIGVEAKVEITSLHSRPTWIQFGPRYGFFSTLKKSPHWPDVKRPVGAISFTPYYLPAYLHGQVIVERTKGVGDHLIIVGIILPFPIYEKLILVPSRGKSDNLGPPPFDVHFHSVLLDIPTVKVPSQDGFFRF